MSISRVLGDLQRGCEVAGRGMAEVFGSVENTGYAMDAFSNLALVYSYGSKCTQGEYVSPVLDALLQRVSQGLVLPAGLQVLTFSQYFCTPIDCSDKFARVDGRVLPIREAKNHPTSGIKLGQTRFRYEWNHKPLKAIANVLFVGVCSLSLVRLLESMDVKVLNSFGRMCSFVPFVGKPFGEMVISQLPLIGNVSMVCAYTCLTLESLSYLQKASHDPTKDYMKAVIQLTARVSVLAFETLALVAKLSIGVTNPVVFFATHYITRAVVGSVAFVATTTMVVYQAEKKHREHLEQTLLRQEYFQQTNN